MKAFGSSSPSGDAARERSLWRKRLLAALAVFLGLSLVLGTTVFREQVVRAAPVIAQVFVVNDTRNPVPVHEQGTIQVAGAVDVAHDSSDLEPYQHTAPIIHSLAACTHQLGAEDRCFATFPAPPAGKRLVITYVSAYFFYIPSNQDNASNTVHVQVGDDTTFIDLPAPAVVSSTRMVAASPVSFYHEPDPDSVLRVTVKGFNLFVGGEVAHEGTATIVGYLVSID